MDEAEIEIGDISVCRRGAGGCGLPPILFWCACAIGGDPCGIRCCCVDQCASAVDRSTALNAQKWLNCD